MDERDQIRSPVWYRRVLDEFQEIGISYFIDEHAIRVNDTFAVFVICCVDLIDFLHVHLARVSRQQFPIVVDNTLERVLRGAQQLIKSKTSIL